MYGARGLEISVEKLFTLFRKFFLGKYKYGFVNGLVYSIAAFSDIIASSIDPKEIYSFKFS